MNTFMLQMYLFYHIEVIHFIIMFHLLSSLIIWLLENLLLLILYSLYLLS